MYVVTCLCAHENTHKYTDSFFCLYLHISLRGLFNVKSILVEQSWYYLTYSYRIRGFITF